MKITDLVNCYIFTWQHIFIFFRSSVVVVYYTVYFPAVHLEAIEFLSQFFNFRVKLLLEISIISADIILIVGYLGVNDGFLGEEECGEDNKLVSTLFSIFDGGVVHVM